MTNEKLADELRYIAEILRANQHKFTVPDHIPTKIDKLHKAASILATLRPEAADRIEALEARIAGALTLLDEASNALWSPARQVDIVKKLQRVCAALRDNT